jgi:flagellar biosynthesis protein FlhF
LKIRKFFAGSSREALRLVREALGPDAVVLSNRAVDGGVELVALAENDLATLAHPGLSAEPLHDSAGLAQGAPMASAARAAPMSQAQPLSYAQVPSRGAAALPDPFASTFGAPAASVDHPAHYASGAAAPRSPSRPTWDDQHTAGAAASYDGRSQAPPPRRPAEANQAVDHVVERAVERSMRQQSERIAAWRAESAAAQNSGYDAQADTRQAARSGQPTDSRQDSRQEARQDAHGDTRHGARQEHQPNSHQDARGEWPSARRSQAAQPVPAQFTPQAPQPHDQIVHAAPAPLTPAGAMARKLGAPATALPSDAHSHAPSQATHGRHGERHTAQRDNGASAVSPAAQTLPFAEPVTAAARTVSARQEVAMTLPDSAAAFAVPPVRSYPALAALPQPAYAMRTTVNASMASRFPAQVTPAPVVAASLPEPLGTSAGAAPPMTAATAAAATASSVAAATPLPAAATPASPSPEMPVSAAASGATSDDFDGLHDLAAQLAAQPAEQAEQAQARVAELVAQSVIGEIHSMRGVIEEQLAGLLWSDRQRRDPARGQAAKTLLAAGFSSQLVKLLIERMPTQLDHAQAMDWLKAALGRNLPVLQNEDALLERGGVYALMGPTGVGKTTTTAKLAARCVMRYGANRVALLTTDSYRIGAHEQLRIYGKILGVGVHAVKDAADLRLALSELRNKHMVLIDTIGMSQRDRTVSEQVAMLCGTGTPVQRLLLLNATSHGDTLNEVVHAYRNRQAAEGADLAGCILTKLDEATNIGAVLDTVIRYRLPVHYVSTGQKVPENLYVARKDFLIESAFAVPRESSPFAPAEDELAAMMAAVPTHAATDVSEVRLG